MQYLMFIYLIAATAAISSVTFQWLKNDKKFDCVVGITVDNKPVGIGTLLFENILITSANPLEPYLEKKSTDSDEYVDKNNIIKLHAIDKAFNKNKILKVEAYNGNIAKRNDVWVRMGFNRTHSPIHDLMVISIKKGQVKKPPVGRREAFYLSPNFTSYFRSHWTFASFGCADGIANNTILELNSFKDTDVEDCDEWIPRPWGRFVCLSNVDSLVGIQSGAPLFNKGALRGIGSFALKKGKESILVFTDNDLYNFEGFRTASLN